MENTIDWVNKYWRLISFAAWLVLATLILFADNRYSKTDDSSQLERRVINLEVQYSVIVAQLTALNNNQVRILDKLDRDQ